MAISASGVSVLPLSSEEKETIRRAFGETGANLAAIKGHIHSIVLPKIRDALGWSSIRAIKGRVNDWRTVELKYNSLFHRDRHVYGDPQSETLRESSLQNLSAVVYLDKARLDYIDGSAVPGHRDTQLKELELDEGSIALFPSCLIHRAVASPESKQRRTIVLFDIENPAATEPLRHDIVACPGWTQKPLLDGIFGADNVEDQMLRDLIANRPYFWRYYRRNTNRRVHWQVTTTATSAQPAGGVMGNGEEANSNGAAAPTIAFNTSFYLIGSHEDYPAHVKFHDHRGTARYLFNLVRFHLGFEVIA